MGSPATNSLKTSAFKREMTATIVLTVFGLGRKGLRCQMICVDDASSDASPAILRDLAATHPDLIAILGDDNRAALPV